MWTLLTNILTNAALIVPIIAFIVVFVNGRDERIIGLTKMKIEVENFEKKFSPVYRGIQRKVEPPTEYELEEINKVEDEIKLNEQEGRDKLKMFIIFLFIYLLFTMQL
jgi:hypothetical protein